MERLEVIKKEFLRGFSQVKKFMELEERAFTDIKEAYGFIDSLNRFDIQYKVIETKKLIIVQLTEEVL
ncbi:MAG: hypothetical protein ACRCTZ_15070 [Sarcina sp.]